MIKQDLIKRSGFSVSGVEKKTYNKKHKARINKRYYRVLVELGDYWQVIAAGKTRKEALAIATNYEGAKIKACWRKK